MMKTNIATTQDQSQRLLRCGVSAESADMCYDSGALSLMDYDSAVHERDSRRETYEVIPAWSLSALMTKILPSHIRYKGHTSLLEITSSNWQSDEQIWEVAYDIDLGVDASDPIEACVLMVEKLVANGYKLNEQ